MIIKEYVHNLLTFSFVDFVVMRSNTGYSAKWFFVRSRNQESTTDNYNKFQL